MIVVPIAITVVDWKSYLTSAKQSIGYSLSTVIDECKLKHDVGAFVVTLTQIQTDEKIDPIERLRNAGNLLRHCSSSFVCVLTVETLNRLREEVDLVITSTPALMGGYRFAVISGTLLQWKNAIIDCSGELMPMDIRLLANKFMGCFEHSGLGAIWADYSKQPMNDSSIKLISKK